MLSGPKDSSSEQKSVDAGHIKKSLFGGILIGLITGMVAASLLVPVAPSESEDTKTSSEPTTSGSQAASTTASEGTSHESSTWSAITSFVDTSAEPCHNFYAFTCGAYKHPSGHTIAQMQDEMYDQLLNILSSVQYPEQGQSAAQKAAALYHNCLKARDGGVDDSTALRQFIKSVGLALPLRPEVEALDKVLLLFFKYNLLTLLGLSLEDSQLDKGMREIKVALNVDQLSWFRQRESELLMAFYPSHLDALGLVQHSEEALRIAIDIAATENTAISLLTKETLEKAGSMVFSTVGDIGIRTPSVKPGRWATLISRHSDGLYQKHHKVQISVSAVAYFDDVHSNLGEVGTSLLTAWELLRTLAPLSSPHLAKRVQYFQLLCLRYTVRAMEVPLLSHYLFKAVPDSTVVSAKTMLMHMRRSVTYAILHADWLDNATRSAALDKMRTLRAHIGYPRFFGNDEELNEAYARYPDVSGRFLTPWLSAMKLSIEWEVRNSSSFKFSLRATNAAYIPMRNKLILPATILRPPVFVPGAPMAYNYGGLGSVIGHDMTHVFGVQGSMWDSRGKPRDWWSKSSRLLLNDKLTCLRRSHGSTRDVADSENMADFAGVVSAYAAYVGLRAKEEQWMGTGLQQSVQRLFFVSTCLKWCATLKNVTFANYAPWRDRCVIPLKNMKAFKDAFGCRGNSSMMQSPRCSFW
ncbi:membrane metallo-endopeptidase-like 1 [Amblyomma americanum]